jgi:hypothetical protein
MGMSSPIPPIRFGWKVKEMSNTGTKAWPDHQLLDPHEDIKKPYLFGVACIPINSLSA